MIEIKDLKKSYGAAEILKGVSFDIKEGETVVIIGKSGSGKTTLLRCLNFLEQADSGIFTLGDTQVDFSHITRAQKDAVRKKTSMVFQSYNLQPDRAPEYHGSTDLHQKNEKSGCTVPRPAATV